jgi:hypothetical protein
VSWKFVNENSIKHDDGHIIDLLEGTWAQPTEVKPRFAKNIDIIIIPRLLREGLKVSSNLEYTSSKKKPYSFPKKDLRILSIKKMKN